jgi:hypothetical protein
VVQVNNSGRRLLLQSFRLVLAVEAVELATVTKAQAVDCTAVVVAAAMTD